MRQWIFSIAALLVTLLPVNALSPPVPVGSEFQVNTYTPNSQDFPSIAADAAGDFVIVWASQGQDGSGSGVFGQRFSASGVASGTEFQVNTYTLGQEGGLVNNFAVSRAADGAFVVVWKSELDGSAYGISGRRYDNTGAPVGPEFQVNAYTPGYQQAPRAASAPNGDFIVAWRDSTRDGSSGGVFARRFNSAGAAIGTDFQLNAYTLGDQGGFLGPRLAFDGDGAFIAVWTENRDGSSTGVFGRRFVSSGAASGTDFQVNVYTPGYQWFPSVAAHPDGAFVVVWGSGFTGNSQDGHYSSVWARRYDSSGAPIGNEIQVNSYTVGSQDPSQEAAFVDANGRFVIVWTSFNLAFTSSQVFGQQYDSSGLPLGSEFQINTYTTGYHGGPVVTGGSGGDFVVGWQSSAQDGSDYGIFAQRFQAESLATNTPTATPTGAQTATPTNTPTVTPTGPAAGACPLGVDGGCTTGFEKASFLIKEDIEGKEKLIAKMVKGPALTQTDLGNPLSGGGTVYSLCIYDDAGNLAGGINGSVVVDRAGDMCSGSPCWKSVGAEPPSGRGYKYKDSALAADGVLKVLYKGGDAGKSKAIVKGKGPNLPDGIPAALQTTAFATVQLRSSDGICLSVAVDDIKKQAPGSFKAKFAAP